MRKIFTLLTLLLFSLLSYAQIDDEFWFVAPDIAQSHGDRPIWMRISTMEDEANITLRMPANLAFGPIIQNIPANTTFSIDLTPWIDIIENTPADQVLDRGLLLTSDNDVTAYYECAHTNNPGIFSMKGKNAVGTEFFIVSQDDYHNQVGQESFEIVATEDNTTISITPSDDIIGHDAGDTFIITLNKGETYSCRAVHTSAEHTLNGSYITSDKPIAVTWQDDSIYQGGAYDIVCDQIIPTNILGMEYIAIRGWANTNERIYVCGTKANTDIFINGGATPAATIQPGELFKYQLPGTDNTVYLDASEPVHMMHLSGFNNELGASILPQDSCTGSEQIGFNRTNNNNFALLLLTRNGNEGSFILNGSGAIITAADFTVVPGTSDTWVYARKQLSTGEVPVGPNLIQNTLGKFHLGIVHQTGASAEYGYFSDFSSLYLGADASMCPGDSIILDGGSNMTTYEWYQLLGGVWTQVGSNRYYTVLDSGYFSCVVNGNFCTLMDTIQVSIYPNATVDLGPDTNICEGTSLTLNPGSFVSYEWSDGSTSPTITVGDEGEYWVEVINNNDCIARDTMFLSIDSIPLIPDTILGGADPLCQGSTWLYEVDSVSYATSYAWTLPSGAIGASDSSSILVDFGTASGMSILAVHGVNECGSGPDTIRSFFIETLPDTPVPINGPDTVCQLEAPGIFSINAIPNATSYGWSFPPGVILESGAGTNSVTASYPFGSESGLVAAWGINMCGEGDKTYKELIINPYPEPSGPITGPDTVCQGAAGITYSIDSIPGASKYIWELPASTSVTGSDSSRSIVLTWDSTAVNDTLMVRGWSSCGIGERDTLLITVNPLPEPAGTIGGLDTVCQGATNITYSIDPVAHASSYVWDFPTGAAIISGAGTNQVEVSFSRDAVGGVITAQGYNDTCGLGAASSLLLVVNPLPDDAGMITGMDTVCQNQSGVLYSVPEIAHAFDYHWNYTGNHVTITNNGHEALLDFSPHATSGTLTVYASNNCGDGIVSPGFPIYTRPCPVVSFTLYPDVTTREAQPILLRGGIPLGGTYSGTAVASGWFTPSLVPYGNDTVVITYNSDNQHGCYNEATDTIILRQLPSPFTCGDTLLDVRDSIRYPTVLLGTQCWMASNLNYGNVIASAQPQRDNLVPEKYCYEDNPALCALGSVLYQWDELMQYRDEESIQGLCPPGWHLPTETEWTVLFNQFINNGFAGNALKYNGYSGFNAFMTGIGFHTNQWKYPVDDPVLRSTIFWSSTSHGTRKAWAHGMNEVAADDEYTPSVSFYPAFRFNAFPVRCIKD
jgi:uncharacterized protein (TIGR02145 family)